MRLILLIFSFFLLNSSFAEEKTPTAEGIVLPAGKVVEGNYYAMGSNLEISGVVNGDLYVFATQVFIDGQVNGDVLAAGGNIEIAGNVANNVRIISGQLMISGEVGRNATIVSGNAQITPSAKIHGNVVCTAGNVDLGAPIDSNVTIIASNLRISNLIKGNLDAHVGQLRLTSKAQVEGNVDYTSSSMAWVDPGAKIGGNLNHHPTFVSGIVKGKWFNGLRLGSKIAAILMNFFYTLAVGWILIRVFPKNLETALYSLNHNPVKALGFGVMLLILFPVVSLILLMTILGAPFALTALALNIVSFYTAKVYTIFWVSTTFFPKIPRIKFRLKAMPTFTIGLIIYFFLTFIPYFGTLVAFAAMLLGLDAGLMAQSRPKSIFSR